MSTRVRAGCLGIALGILSIAAAAAEPDACKLTSRSLVRKASVLRESSQVPALSAAVVVRGKVVAKGTVGVRAEGGPPALDSDAWHIGSITKPITATLAARLVERDLLRFSSTLEGLDADLISSSERSYASVTVLDLLSHHSGVGTTAEEQGREAFRDDLRPLPEQRRSFSKLLLSQTPLAAPGARHEYANGNYVIMGAILERLAKDSWEHLVAKEVLTPLGLKSAGFGTPPGATHPELPAVMRPAGGLHMTMEDLAMFGYRHAAGEFEADGYLSPETYRLLHADQGETAAMGWFTQPWRGHRLLSHTGSNGYWYAMVAVQPEKRVAIAVATNVRSESAQAAVHEMVSALARSTILGECLQ